MIVKVASDEGAFLQLEQLQKGLLQFTDTTNAYRFFKEYGTVLCLYMWLR
jgi:hypothetical protein